MKSRILFLLFSCFTYMPAFSQTMKGKIKLNENWKPVVYLIEVSHYQGLFSGSADRVVDSFYVSTEGYFYFDKLKPNTLYRLNVIPKSSDISGMLIQDGSNDNYAFFVTNERDKTIYFTGDMASLFRSYELVSVDQTLNELEKQVLFINKTKLPNYDLMDTLGKQMDKIPASDTMGLARFQHNAINQLQDMNRLTNISLLKYLQGMRNPQVLALGLIYYDFEQNYSDTGISVLVQKLRLYDEQPLIASILDKVHEISDKKDISFLSKEYNLIGDGSIRMDTIQSRFILLDFWASWCLPCRKAIKGELKELISNFKKDELQIIGVNTDPDKEKAVRAIKKDNNTNLQIWEGGSRYLQDFFNVKVIPYYVLVDTKNNNVAIIKSAEMVQNKIREIFSTDQ